jgi:hypothetical protein
MARRGTIAQTATAKIEHVRGKAMRRQTLHNLEPHAPRTDPTMQKEHVTRSGAVPLYAKLHAVVFHEFEHARTFRTQWV